jgi:hypothetical protein
VAKKLNPPIIDDTGGDDVVQIKFPNGRHNTVLFARKDSKCDILKQMYEFIDRNKNCFELLHQVVPSHLWEEDTLAGGKYLPGMAHKVAIPNYLSKLQPSCVFHTTK